MFEVGTFLGESSREPFNSLPTETWVMSPPLSCDIAKGDLRDESRRDTSPKGNYGAFRNSPSCVSHAPISDVKDMGSVELHIDLTDVLHRSGTGERNFDVTELGRSGLR